MDYHFPLHHVQAENHQGNVLLLFLTFNQTNNINSIGDLSEKSSPDGFTFKKLECSVLFYRTCYEEGDISPYLKSIEVNQDLHAKLHPKGSKVPLSAWFNSMHRCKMTSVGMLQNFVSHMHNIATSYFG